MTFAQAMSEAGGIDLNQFKLWYEQPGTPQVEVRESFADGTLNLEIVQAPADLPNQKHQRAVPHALGLRFVGRRRGSVVVGSFNATQRR
jgi:aminopeptidase N